MTQPRAALVSLDVTPWYHLVNRCVRRAFLCGTDTVSGQCHEHRRGWIAERLHQLAGVFAIDVAAYAVMSNHYHLVVRVDAQRVAQWSDDEVLRRWTSLFTGPLPVRQYLESGGQGLSPGVSQAVVQWVAIYRERLADISWFSRVSPRSSPMPFRSASRTTLSWSKPLVAASVPTSAVQFPSGRRGCYSA